MNPSFLLHLPTAKHALDWVAATEPHQLPKEHYCPTRDILSARLNRCRNDSLLSEIPEQQSYLLRAITGEIGNNSFDHNLGSWPDTPGILFEWGQHEKCFIIALADRGQGIKATLKRVRPSIQSDEEALKIAFTERLSGRAPERRGNGLKYVRSILLEDGLDMWFQSGNATYSMLRKKEEWHSTDMRIPGCLAILRWSPS